MRKGDRLDVVLLRRGWVSEAQITQALEVQRRSGGRFGSVLVQLGFLTETQLAEALAEQYSMPKWDPLTAVVETAALKLFPEAWVRQKKILPLALDSARKCLEIAVADPANIALADEIRFRANVKTLSITVAPEISLQRLWHHFYRKEADATSAPLADGKRPPDRQANPSDRLGLEFSFAVDAPVQWENQPQPTARVLLWLSQPFVARLLKALLEVERCQVAHWDGENLPQGEWDCLVYDNDNAASRPQALGFLKRACPKIQLILRPSWATALLRSPLPYEQLKDGYLHLAEFAISHPVTQPADRRLSRYAHALARILPMTRFEIDTLLVACELSPFIPAGLQTDEEWNAVAQELSCPYPVIEVIRSVGTRFDEMDLRPGQSLPGAPLGGRVLAVLSSYLQTVDKKPVSTIEAMGEMAAWLRSESGSMFDPLVVEGLVRLVREEVLDGYLPPGPAEVMLVSDHPVDWSHFVLQLENEGWRVVTANGVAEARKLADRRKPDAIVWAASGALEWIRRGAQTVADTAMFLVLDEPDPHFARAALAAGFEDVWSGPWDPGVAIEKLQRAVARQPKSEPKEGVVTGSLAQFGFIDMVQIIAVGARSVRIDLVHGSRKAQVQIWQGQIKYAESGDKEAEAAVYDIVSWDGGTFTMTPIEAAPSTNCRVSNQAMLLEGCRLLDESKAAPVEA